MNDPDTVKLLAVATLFSCGALLSPGLVLASDPTPTSTRAPRPERQDPRDAEIARLKAQIEAFRNAGPRREQPAAAPQRLRQEAHAAPKEETPDATWQSLMEGNKRFVQGRPQAREFISARKKLVDGQAPRAIILSCSDSRVGPELLFDQTLGDIFVVRTAGNVADAVALGSIEYAVEHLHAKLLVVLGHESCGAVAAAASGAEPRSPNLRAIVSRIRPAIAKLDVCGPGPLAARLKVEANVGASARDLVSSSAVIREAASKNELQIVQAVYQLSNGEVMKLDQPMIPTFDPPQETTRSGAVEHPRSPTQVTAGR